MSISVARRKKQSILPIPKPDLNGQSVSVCESFPVFSMNNSCGRGAFTQQNFFSTEKHVNPLAIVRVSGKMLLYWKGCNYGE